MHGWKWRSVRAVASSSCTESWMKGSPSLSRSRWVITSLTACLGQRQHQCPPFLPRPGRVGPRGDLRQRRNRVAPLDPADGGLADAQRRRDPCPGQAREHANPL